MNLDPLKKFWKTLNFWRTFRNYWTNTKRRRERLWINFTFGFNNNSEEVPRGMRKRIPVTQRLLSESLACFSQNKVYNSLLVTQLEWFERKVCPKVPKDL